MECRLSITWSHPRKGSHRGLHKFHYPESAELRELVVLKTRGWVRRDLRDPDGLTELKEIARDNIGSASSAVPAAGSSDVPTRR